MSKGNSQIATPRDSTVKVGSRGSFARNGLRQAAWLVLTLLFFSGVGWIGLRTISTDSWLRVPVVLVLVFAVSVLSGPLPAVLTCFDISNKLFHTLWPMLILPYWAILGTSVGIIRWKKCTSDATQERGAASRQHSNATRWTIEIVAVILAVISLPLGPVMGPVRVSTRHWPGHGVINNLRQLDGAKQQLALERKLSPDYVPTEAELSPYLYKGTNFFSRPVGPIRYVLNPISKPPYAVLDSDWKFRRRGWREGFTITNGTVFKLP